MAIQFDPDSPAARKLVSLVFDKLKETWDPSLTEDAVAQYAVALASRGWDRKKLLKKLQELLHDVDACNLLLDWLLPYVKSHKNELESSQAPVKPAGTSGRGTTAKAAPAKQATPAPEPAKTAAQEPPAQAAAVQELNDIDEVLNDLPSDMLTDLEDDTEQQQEEEEAPAQDDAQHAPRLSSTSRDQGPVEGSRPASNAAASTSSKQPGQRLTSQRSAEKPTLQQQGSKGEAAAGAGEGGRTSRMKSVILWTAPGAGSDAGGLSKDADELARRRARFGKGNSDVGTAALDGQRRGLDREREQDNGGSRRGRSRSRSPPQGRGEARERNGRRRPEQVDLHARGPAGAAHTDAVKTSISPTGRSRLRSTVSGNPDGVGPEVVEGSGRRLPGPARLALAALKGGSAASGVFARLQRRGDANKGAGEETRAEHTVREVAEQQQQDGEHRKSIFERLVRGRASAQENHAAGTKRPAPDSPHDGNTSEDHADVAKLPRTDSARGIGSALVSKAFPGQGTVPTAAAAVKAAQPRSATMAAGAVAQARTRQQQAAAATAAAAAPAQAAQPAQGGDAKVQSTAPPVKPAGAAGVTVSAVPLAAPAAQTNGTAAAGARGGAMSEMAILMAEMKRKEMEINRIKSSLATQPQPTTAAAAPVAKTLGGGPSPQQVAAAAELAANQAARRADADAKSVTVRNLPPLVTEEMLAAHFGVVGAVKRLTVVRNHMTGLAIAAHIEYQAPESKFKALALNNSIMVGMQLQVMLKQVAQPGKPASGAHTGPRPGSTGGTTAGAGNGNFAHNGHESTAAKRLANAPPLQQAKVWKRAAGVPPPQQARVLY